MLDRGGEPEVLTAKGSHKVCPQLIRFLHKHFRASFQQANLQGASRNYAIDQASTINLGSKRPVPCCFAAEVDIPEDKACIKVKGKQDGI